MVSIMYLMGWRWEIEPWRHPNGDVRMVITDDGKGLDPEKTDKTKTLGLLGMKERALMMGGRLEIGNGEKSGLQLVLIVPLPPVLT